MGKYKLYELVSIKTELLTDHLQFIIKFSFQLFGKRKVGKKSMPTPCNKVHWITFLHYYNIMANNKLSLNAVVRVDSKKGVVEYLYTLQKYITVIGVKKLTNS